jgi:hypothetical protein
MPQARRRGGSFLRYAHESCALSPRIDDGLRAETSRNSRKERAMKLNPARITYAANQLQAFPLPETHPMMESLADVFGDHTFFLDNEGLAIVEAEGEAVDDDAELGVVVRLARWGDEGRTVLSPPEREVTNLLLTLSEAA